MSEKHTPICNIHPSTDLANLPECSVCAYCLGRDEVLKMLNVRDDLLAALESAPEPPDISIGAIRNVPRQLTVWFQEAYGPWFKVRAAALAKAKA